MTYSKVNGCRTKIMVLVDQQCTSACFGCNLSNLKACFKETVDSNKNMTGKVLIISSFCFSQIFNICVVPHAYSVYPGMAFILVQLNGLTIFSRPCVNAMPRIVMFRLSCDLPAFTRGIALEICFPFLSVIKYD